MANKVDPAKTRLTVLTALRVGGLLLAFLGAALYRGWIGQMAGHPVALSLVVAGVLVLLLVPRILIRRWRQQDAAAHTGTPAKR